MRIQKAATVVVAVCVFVALTFAGSDAGKSVSVNGYVLDSACAFTKGLTKPISAQCAQACAKAGSPRATTSWPLTPRARSAGCAPS